MLKKYFQYQHCTLHSKIQQGNFLGFELICIFDEPKSRNLTVQTLHQVHQAHRAPLRTALAGFGDVGAAAFFANQKLKPMPGMVAMDLDTEVMVDMVWDTVPMDLGMEAMEDMEASGVMVDTD